jgi:hypothetical protein
MVCDARPVIAVTVQKVKEDKAEIKEYDLGHIVEGAPSDHYLFSLLVLILKK